MILTIDLSKEKIKLTLENGGEKIAETSWAGLFQLSKTLLPKIDRFFKKNKVNLKDIEKIEVIESKESMVSNRVAKAIALGLKI